MEKLYSDKAHTYQHLQRNVSKNNTQNETIRACPKSKKKPFGNNGPLEFNSQFCQAG